MKFRILMALLAFTSTGLCVDQACVKSLASAPYCLNVLSAESNCRKGEGEIKSIKECMDQFSKADPAKLKLLREKGLIARMCLLDEVTDTSAGARNKSLCDAPQAQAPAPAAAPARGSSVNSLNRNAAVGAH